jgi:hypothetical protein
VRREANAGPALLADRAREGMRQPLFAGRAGRLEEG